MEKNNNTTNLKKSKKKRNIRKIFITVLLIATAVGAPFLIYWIMQVSLKTKSPMVVVISGSMEPTYSKGDLLFLSGEEPKDIGFGDVIVFDARGVWLSPPAEPVVHRVVNITFYGGIWWYMTKGDANILPDQWSYQPEGEFNPFIDPRWIPQTKIIGKVVGRIPFIGWIKIFFTENIIYPVLIIILCILVISLIYDYIKGEDKENSEDKSENDFSTKNNFHS